MPERRCPYSQYDTVTATVRDAGEQNQPLGVREASWAWPLVRTWTQAPSAWRTSVVPARFLSSVTS